MPGKKRKATVITRYAAKRVKKSVKAAPRDMKSLRATISKVLNQKMELKFRNVAIAKLEVNHQTYYGMGTSGGNLLAMCYPSQGTADYERIGDSIMQRGLKVRMLLGQKYDRPNVTWRIFVLASKNTSTAPSITQLIDQTTGNVLLDQPNTDFCKVVYMKTLKKQFPNMAAIGGVVDSREITYTHQFYLKLPRKVVFSTNAGTDPGYSDLRYDMIITAFDAYGSLTNDNIGYVQTFLRYYYKDP